jgi:hypothetical protein
MRCNALETHMADPKKPDAQNQAVKPPGRVMGCTGIKHLRGGIDDQGHQKIYEIGKHSGLP